MQSLYHLHVLSPTLAGVGLLFCAKNPHPLARRPVQGDGGTQGVMTLPIPSSWPFGVQL